MRVKRYRKVGRESGVVSQVREQGFGFVRSHARDTELYFRTKVGATVI